MKIIISSSETPSASQPVLPPAENKLILHEAGTACYICVDLLPIDMFYFQTTLRECSQGNQTTPPVQLSLSVCATKLNDQADRNLTEIDKP